MLKAKRFYLIRCRANKADAGLFTFGCKLGVLAQKPVAGMDFSTDGISSHRENLVGVEIALHRRGWTNSERFVSQGDMHGVRIRVRKDRDRLDAQFVQGANDAAGNLAPIGD